MILDLDGTVRLSTVPRTRGIVQKDAPTSPAGPRTRPSRTSTPSALTRSSDDHGRDPLFDQNGGGQRVAVLAANLSLERLDRIILERTGLGETGRPISSARDSPVHPRADEPAGAAPRACTPPGSTTRWPATTARRCTRTTAASRSSASIAGWPSAGRPCRRDLAGEAFAPARELALVIGVVGLLSALLLAIGIWLIAQHVTRPILDLAATATRLRGGDLTRPRPSPRRTRWAPSTRAFNDMTAQLRENVETLERRVDERTAELTTALGEIRRQKQYFESLVEISPAAVVTMDRDERVLGWNPGGDPPLRLHRRTRPSAGRSTTW